MYCHQPPRHNRTASANPKGSNKCEKADRPTDRPMMCRGACVCLCVGTHCPSIQPVFPCDIAIPAHITSYLRIGASMFPPPGSCQPKYVGTQGKASYRSSQVTNNRQFPVERTTCRCTSDDRGGIASGICKSAVVSSSHASGARSGTARGRFVARSMGEVDREPTKGAECPDLPIASDLST